MHLPEDDSPLTNDTFRKISEWIRDSTGLQFDNISKIWLARRLAPRLEELGLYSFDQYYLHLRYHPDKIREMDALLDSITTHETYFFREETQLRAFREEVLPQLIRSHPQDPTLRIWCAGCASGEEAYTIAILCRQSANLIGWNVNIWGTDISEKMIESAQRGEYTETSFRSTPPDILNRYFEKIADNRLRVRDEIRQMVTFRKTNLVDEKAAPGANLDAVFCRNVIIYLANDAREKIIDLFYTNLRSGGYLFLGHSESLAAFYSRFKLRHLRNEMVYQK